MQLSPIALEGFDPYDTTCWSDTGFLGINIGKALKKVSRVVKKVAKTVAKSPIVRSAVNAAKQGLAATGPLGMAAAGALGGIEAVVRGKNLKDIALSALEGASPPGIRQAIHAGARIARGDNVMRVAMSATLSELTPEGQRAANLAFDALKTGRGLAELAKRRRSLPTEQARRAFDLAVGRVSKAARINPEVSRRSAQRSSMRAGRAASAAAAKYGAAMRRAAAQRQAAQQAAKRSGVQAARTAAMAAARRRAQATVRKPMQITRQQQAAARRRLWGLTAPGAVRDPLTEARMRTSSVIRPRSGQPIDRILAHNPGLATLRPTELAARLHVHPSQALAALSRRARRVRPQSLSPNALRMVAAFSPAVPLGLFRRDTTGFERSGSEWIYVVEKGDYPYKLAQKYAPGGSAKAGTTYRQLLKANPQYPLNAKRDNFKNFWAGMRLKWPSGWSVPASAEPAPEPTKPEVAPTEVIPAATASLTSIVQAKALLATWGVSDGASEPGISDYGQSPQDLTTSWAERDKFQLMAFSRWSNSARGTSLDTDGSLDAEHLAALKAWAEQKAQAPTVPAVKKTPEAVTTKPKPVEAPTVTLPTLPLPTIEQKPKTPSVVSVPEIIIKSPGPAIGTPVEKAAPIKVAQPEAKKEGSGALPLIAIAAAFATGIL